MPALRVTTAGCRFVTPAGRGFLEQVGIGLPDVHRAAVEWTDSDGTYEGTGVYRRIDGAAEREDVPFSQGPGGLRHLPAIGGWEEGDGWDFPPLRSRVTAAEPDS
jgi:hypothetical protein